MEINIWTAIHLITFSLCLFATIGLSIYSILRYCRNDDTTLVQVSQYHTSDDNIYPSLTICIRPPFLVKEFERLSLDRINMSSYKDFLFGKHWDEQMLGIDYDNVTVSLANNLFKSYYTTMDRIFHTYKPIISVSFRSYHVKCFTIDAPNVKEHMLKKSYLVISNNVFPNGARSPDNLRISLHYPGQYFTSGPNVHKWDIRQNKTKNYKMLFYLKNVNVIAHRNKLQRPCIEDWKSYDEYAMNAKMLEIGCRPPHWVPTTDVPICNNAKQMKEFRFRPIISKFKPPCRLIDRLDHDYVEDDEKDDTKHFDTYVNFLIYHLNNRLIISSCQNITLKDELLMKCTALI